MPERSGPTLPPSPPCMWHLAHCCLKTCLPLAASPACEDHAAPARRLPSAGRRSGRPPPLARSTFARAGDRPVRGEAASACFWSSEQLASSRLALLEAVDEAAVQSARASRTRSAWRRTAGVQSRQLVDDAAPRLGGFAAADGLDQAGGQLGGRPRRDQARAAPRRVASSLRPEVDELAGRVAPRSSSGATSSSAEVQERSGDLGSVFLESPGRPSGSPGGRAGPGAAAESLASSSPWTPRLARRAAPGGPSGQPSARPASMPSDDRRLPPSSATSKRATVRPARRGRSARPPVRRCCDGPGPSAAQRRPRCALRNARRLCRRGRGGRCVARASDRCALARLQSASAIASAAASDVGDRPAASRAARPDLGIGVVQQPADSDRGGRCRRSRAGLAAALRRTPAERMVQRRDGGGRCVAASEPSSAQARAASTGRGWRPAFRPMASTEWSCDQRRSSAGATSSLPRSTSSRCACNRQNMVVVLQRRPRVAVGVVRIELRRLWASASCVNDAVDAAVGLVAERGLVGVALAGLEALGRGVVLDDVVVPVDDPDVARRGRPRPRSARSTRRRWPAGSSRSAATKSAALRDRAVNVAVRWPVGSVTKAVRFQYPSGRSARCRARGRPRP